VHSEYTIILKIGGENVDAITQGWIDYMKEALEKDEPDVFVELADMLPMGVDANNEEVQEMQERARSKCPAPSEPASEVTDGD